MLKSAAWQRKAGQNPKGGLNAKGRASYKAQSMTVGLYLIIKKCSVHIKVTSVCG